MSESILVFRDDIRTAKKMSSYCIFVYAKGSDITKIEGQCPLVFGTKEEVKNWLMEEGDEFLGKDIIVIRELEYFSGW